MTGISIFSSSLTASFFTSGKSHLWASLMMVPQSSMVASYKEYDLQD